MNSRNSGLVSLHMSTGAWLPYFVRWISEVLHKLVICVFRMVKASQN